MESIAISVSDAVAVINQTLEAAYPVVVVEGEVGSFSVSKSRYVFFDIKDETASLNCFMTVWQLRLPIEDGMRVRVVAQPRITDWGKFSLTVREVQPIGEGSIKRSRDALQKKLAKEGLFDETHKHALPSLPTRIGVISSAQAAGYIDFVTILSRRWRGLEVVLANVGVQGLAAADQIVSALSYFETLEEDKRPDVIALVRGGGSADDLAVFNDEKMVRAIAATNIPIITAIGHEIDTSLADLAADVRAATPSEAAERLTPDIQVVLRSIDTTHQQIRHITQSYLDQSRQTIEHTQGQLATLVTARLRELRQMLDARQDLLTQLHPSRALARGYAIVRNASGQAISDAAIGQALTIELETRILQVGVTDVKNR